MKANWQTRAATLGVLAAIFVAGSLVGAAVDRSALATVPSFSKNKNEDRQGGASQGSERSETRGGSRWIIDRVDLDPEQKLQVDSVLDYYRARMNALAESYNNAYWPLVDSTRDDLRRILSSEQRALYDSLLAENDARRGRNGN
jgi:hypothetical protein